MREDGAVGGADDDAAQSVAELRRRADELAVLNDLARRLAALHDTRSQKEIIVATGWRR